MPKVARIQLIDPRIDFSRIRIALNSFRRIVFRYRSSDFLASSPSLRAFTASGF